MTQFADQASRNDFGFPFGFDTKAARAVAPTFFPFASFVFAVASFGFAFFATPSFPFATSAFALSVLFACLTFFTFFVRSRRTFSRETAFFGFHLIGAGFAAFFAILFAFFSLLFGFAPDFGGPDFAALFIRGAFVFGFAFFAFFAFALFGAFADRMGPFGCRREVLLTKPANVEEAANDLS